MKTYGGARPGAGRPKGSHNSLLDKELRASALEGGESPLEFLLGVMRDDQETKERRIDAAKAAAPYVHAKLQTVALTDETHEGPARLLVEWIKE